MQPALLESYLQAAADQTDVAAIQQAWQKLSPPFQIDNWVLPLPPWAKRPYSESGALAWQTLRQGFAHSRTGNPMAIYLHIPFCTSKCGFCDSYSFKLGGHRSEHVDSYVAQLCQEMALWSAQGDLARRPISTVHLGGGTPTFLTPAEFTSIIETCAQHFQIAETTEWALESTVAGLTPAMLACLHALGFRRLHVGVQTLEDNARTAIGRRRPAAEALAKIEEALALGWIVSVDLICGLPGQTITGFLDGILALAAIGVDGFSLYELLIYPQNRQWAERAGLTCRSHLPNYLMFQAGCQLLDRLGYRKNLFNHWANARDDNRYFTFPTRQEDLLALGAIADGVFGDYHYRHPRYQGYRRELTTDFPGLEGGLRRNYRENQLWPLTTAILSGCIRPTGQQRFTTLFGGSGRTLLDAWQAQGLLAADPTTADLWLTANGSWFTGNMLQQIEELYAAETDQVDRFLPR